MAPRQQQGFTLIEALVALLIFSVGILGLVGMQTVSARVSTDARFRSEAAAAADELLARMQSANRATLAAQFATGGPAFDAWLNGRLKAVGTGLPNVAATVTFGVVEDFPSAVPDPSTVRIVISWAPPREAQRNGTGLANALTNNRQHVTVSALYN